MATDNDLLKSGYQHLKNGTLYKKWAPSNSGEAAKLDAFVNDQLAGKQPAPPVVASETGKAFVDFIAMFDNEYIPPPPTTTYSVISSIPSGAVIDKPVTWEATPNLATQKVEFKIDGATAWVEQIAPYQFNGDGNKLDPLNYPLTPGAHDLEIVATSSTGEIARALSKVTVNVTPPPPTPTPAPTGKEGRLLVDPDMSGGWLDASARNSADHAWWLQHFNRCTYYGGFGYTNVTPWFPGGRGYLDSYAIYRSQAITKKAIASIPEMSEEDKSRQGKLWGLQQHHEMMEADGDNKYRDRFGAISDYILKDANGNRVYIDWGCSGGVCPQYAADVGSQGWRDDYLARCKNELAHGAKGIYADDTNLPFRFSNGTSPVTPVDPRTGKTMLQSDWDRYFCEFIEYIAHNLPSGTEIILNTIWFYANHDGSDANTTRLVKAVAPYGGLSYERGFNDTGIHNTLDVNDSWSFGRYLQHMDNTHKNGAKVQIRDYTTTKAGAMFSLGMALMMSKGGDFIGFPYGMTPQTYWPGIDIDLGAAKADRYSGGTNILKRDFDKGTVTVNVATHAVTIPGVS